MSFFFGGFPGFEGMQGGPSAGPQKPVDNSEFYEILGVEKTASADTIKKAYRKAALRNHPDKGGDPEMVCARPARGANSIKNTMFQIAFCDLETPDASSWSSPIPAHTLAAA